MKCAVNRLVGVVFSLCLASGAVVAQTGGTIPWTPSIAGWSCRTAGLERICTFVTEGLVPPTTLSPPYRASVAYKVFKSATTLGQQVLMVNKIDMACTVNGETLRCIAPDELRLGPGISAVDDPAPVTININIFATGAAPTPLLDFNQDGRTSADVEGVAALRYLLGFRDEGVTQGITLAGVLTPQTATTQLGVGVWNGWFQFGSTQNPVATREGVVLLRCLLGLNGAPLVNGLAGFNQAVAESQCGLLLQKN